MYGRSIQASEPSVEHPQEVVNAGDNGEIDVNIFGKNLLIGRAYYSEYATGKAYIKNLTNEVILPYRPNYSTQGIAYIVPCKSGKKYTFSVTNSNPNLSVRISEYKCLDDVLYYKRVIGYTNASKAGNSSTYTAKGNGLIVCMLGGVWSSANDMIHECTESELSQLELGAVATAYEPYKPAQTLILATPNGLAGIPTKGNGNYTDENGQQWICDTIECRDGIAEYVQRIGEIVVNSDAHIAADLADYGALQENTVIGRYFNESIKKETAILCKELQIIENWSNDKESARTVEKGIDFRLSRERIGLGTETTNEQNKTAILKFLETTPLHFVVQLDTPIRTPLTQEEMAAYKALHTYSPNTTVVNDAGCGMSLTYIADTQRYIDKKIAAISAAMIGG